VGGGSDANKVNVKGIDPSEGWEKTGVTICRTNNISYLQLTSGPRIEVRIDNSKCSFCISCHGHMDTVIIWL